MDGLLGWIEVIFSAKSLHIILISSSLQLCSAGVDPADNWGYVETPLYSSFYNVCSDFMSNNTSRLEVLQPANEDKSWYIQCIPYNVTIWKRLRPHVCSQFRRLRLQELHLWKRQWPGESVFSLFLSCTYVLTYQQEQQKNHLTVFALLFLLLASRGSIRELIKKVIFLSNTAILVWTRGKPNPNPRTRNIEPAEWGSIKKYRTRNIEPAEWGSIRAFTIYWTKFSKPEATSFQVSIFGLKLWWSWGCYFHHGWNWLDFLEDRRWIAGLYITGVGILSMIFNAFVIFLSLRNPDIKKVCAWS